MTNTDETNHPKGSKHVARKRKRDSKSTGQLVPTSPNEAGKRHKRATRACERCRNKKIKCDIERDIACNACVDANVICESGNGKHTEIKKYPPGYTECLEHSNQAMILVTDKLWRMVKNREEWTFAEPRMKDGGKGPVVIHDIAQALGCIRNAPGLPENFIEDAPALLARLSAESLAEERSQLEQGIQTEAARSSEEAASPESIEEETSPETPTTFTKWLPSLPLYQSDPFAPLPETAHRSLDEPSTQPHQQAIIQDQKLDTSRMSHGPTIKSANASQFSNVNVLVGNMMSNSPNFPARESFSNRNTAAVDFRRAPGLKIQPQPYNSQEQPALSASSTVSSFSTTHHTNSPLQSTNSTFSPVYQASTPLSYSEHSNQYHASSSSSPYLSHLQKDPCLSPSPALDDFSNPQFYDPDMLLFNTQATSNSFDEASYLTSNDLIFGSGFDEPVGDFSSVDESYRQDLSNY
ncbi:hypothetical protein ACHAO1_004030 [Botrytis cinerea]|uniref:Putative c6 transcription factor protein n=1 Tax=Botryotinia fuckeliana (strain BcDW1) TaxID=1290391 RepID=M7U216_BOTF1|nr:putative c6 transcription factor protein [Botrytis cinerea BcDW1]